MSNNTKLNPNDFFDKVINELTKFIDRKASFKSNAITSLNTLQPVVTKNLESFKEFKYDELVKNIIKEEIMLYLGTNDHTNFNLDYFRHLLNYLNIYKKYEKYEEPKPKVGGGENKTEKELQNRLCGSSSSLTLNMKKKIGCDTYIPNNGSNITNGGGKRKNTKNKRKANKKSKRSKSK